MNSDLQKSLIGCAMPPSGPPRPSAPEQNGSQSGPVRRLDVDFHCDEEAEVGGRFEELLAGLLGAMSGSSAASLSSEFDRVFCRICECLGLDEAGLWCQVDPSNGPLRLVYPSPDREAGCVGNGGARAARIFPLEVGAQPNPRFPWISAEIIAGRAVAFSGLSELPIKAGQDRDALGRLGACSAVVLPVRMGDQVVGAVSFGSGAERAWPARLVRRLALVAQALGNGLTRHHHERELEAALEELRRSRAAIEACALVAATDAEGKILYVNDRFCELSKYSRQELIGKTHRVVSSGFHSREFFQELWATINSGRPWRGEIQDRARDGACYWLATTILPLAGRGGLREFLGIQVDITQRKQAEEALARASLEIRDLKGRLRAETEYLKTEMKLNETHAEIIGQSAAIRQVLQQVEQVAPVECTVLISGETGTGKELVARAIHRLSSRKERVMVMVSCAALPAPLVESELFGREKGAYTGALTSEIGRFELAEGSTIFLDEVGELSPEVQVKLLRVLQEHEFQRLGSSKTRKVNLRVIAATNKDLAREVREGRFREDLFYRLRVFPIEVPPLRERVEDIPLLVSAFVEEFCSRMSKPIHRVPRRVLEILERHPWPGNIRELRNVIERGVILSRGETLVLPKLGESADAGARLSSLAEVERLHILKILDAAGWRVKGPFGAARRLDLNPSTLYSRMAKLGIRRPQPRDGMPT